jgi:phosphate transport system substrate-binding protein
MSNAKQARALTLSLALGLCATLGLILTACGGSGNAQMVIIQNKGSDTMVNVAQAWAEDYRKSAPGVSVEVSGGGSGVGIAALIKGTVHLANSSRNMKKAEIEQAVANTGKEPREYIVGYDALAVYIHKNNPLEEISLAQLAEIYVEDGRIKNWSQLGVTIPRGRTDKIIRVNRQSSSGTYEFFRERVLDKRDFELGSHDMNGSKEAVELVGNTPAAIGYSGMGYATGTVKILRLSPKPGAPAVAPDLRSTLSGEYPIARTLLIYTLGEPEGAVKDYLDWIMSDAGQQIVEASGFVPLPPELRTGGQRTEVSGLRTQD